MFEDEELSRPSSSTSDLAGGAAAISRIRHTAAACEGDNDGGDGGEGDHVLENVLENVLCFLSDRSDRNAVSLVCKSWYRIEAMTRSEVFIGNCYAISPQRVTARFSRVTSLIVKGRPRFDDFNMVPPKWGARFGPWVTVFADAYRSLQKLYLKRMDVFNDDMKMLGKSFPNLKELTLVYCYEIETLGLAFVAGECRKLRVLDLVRCVVYDDGVDWISCFPESKTCLESLTFDCVECDVNFEALEQLVMRSPYLKKLKLNEHVSTGQLFRLMVRAPQLTHLGTGSFEPSEEVDVGDCASAFAACISLVCLSGFREIHLDYLPAIYPVCANLTSLNFIFAKINAEQIKAVICHCHKLQIFWVLDSVCDEGLKAVAATCKDLRELRVFPSRGGGSVSEVGLLAISESCRKLHYILYFCRRMTNAAVFAVSKNCPDLVVFRLFIKGGRLVSGEPMDEGFGAIVKNCRKLTRLSISGLLTDQTFSYIGQYGKTLRTLSVEFAGGSGLGLKFVFEGCPKLQKLEIRFRVRTAFSVPGQDRW